MGFVSFLDIPFLEENSSIEVFHNQRVWCIMQEDRLDENHIASGSCTHNMNLEANSITQC